VVTARLGVLAGVLAACASGLDGPLPADNLDVAYFRCNVQPVVVARCAFFPCHGSATRPYRVFARQRMRLDKPAAARNDALSEDEEQANFDMARGFVRDPADLSLLLGKPLDSDAGGYFHRGKDLFGDEDVFASVDDPGYQIIEAWIEGATDDAACEPIQEVGP
jgi:hypothetical protein